MENWHRWKRLIISMIQVLREFEAFFKLYGDNPSINDLNKFLERYKKLVADELEEYRKIINNV